MSEQDGRGHGLIGSKFQPTTGGLPLWVVEFGTGYDVPAELFVLARVVDVSWHNDVCPSFVHADDHADDKNENPIRIWADHVEPDQRENPDAPRYLVCTGNLDPTFYEGEDVAEALAALAAARAGQRSCVTCGDRFTPTADDDRGLCACCGFTDDAVQGMPEPAPCEYCDNATRDSHGICDDCRKQAAEDVPADETAEPVTLPEGWSEDVCDRCGAHIGWGVRWLHLRQCEDCTEADDNDDDRHGD